MLQTDDGDVGNVVFYLLVGKSKPFKPLFPFTALFLDLTSRVNRLSYHFFYRFHRNSPRFLHQFNLILFKLSTLMAAVLESVLVPRCSTYRSSHASPSMVSPVCSLSRNVKIQSLSEVSGLKIQLQSSTHTFVSSRRITRRRSGIVCEAQDTAVDVPAVTDKTWDELVLKAKLPVLVEFWAPWCGPCRMIHPVIGELSKQYAGKLDFYKLNTDESPTTATQYGIRSIPTVMIFRDGEKKDAVIGAVPKTTLTTSIEKFV